MSLSQHLAEYVAAAFTGIWVRSHEHADALIEIARLCRERNWSLATWDVDKGLATEGRPAAGTAPHSDTDTTDPLAAIRALAALAPHEGLTAGLSEGSPESSSDGSSEGSSEGTAEHTALLVLPNFHRFLSGAEVVQALAHQVQRGKQDRTFVVILSPVVQIPIELEKQFVVLEHELPDRTQVEQIARGVATEEGEMPHGEDLIRLVDAAAGLTRFEAEGAFALSLVRHGRLIPQTVWELKEGMLRKSGLVTLHRGKESFADLGGLDALKQFCLKALSGGSRAARPRGVLLLSPPGCGKSQFCKALGNETARPTLVLDVGALYGSLVGQTEERVRQALRLADAMAPAVLFIDECDKALSGVASSGQSDGGVSARLFGTLLTWLSDHDSDVFVAMTANDVSKLPPEFSRAERFDAIFFLDTPGTAEKEKIWPIHLARYGLDVESRRPESREWTGAEIQSCCRLAALLDVPLKEAAKNVVPVAVTAAESVHRLRAWATGRCLDATLGGVYTRGAESSSPAGRRLSRQSSN